MPAVEAIGVLGRLAGEQRTVEREEHVGSLVGYQRRRDRSPRGVPGVERVAVQERDRVVLQYDIPRRTQLVQRRAVDLLEARADRADVVRVHGDDHGVLRRALGHPRDPVRAHRDRPGRRRALRDQRNALERRLVRLPRDEQDQHDEGSHRDQTDGDDEVAPAPGLALLLLAEPQGSCPRLLAALALALVFFGCHVSSFRSDARGEGAVERQP
jgi:hypothetical protein